MSWLAADSAGGGGGAKDDVGPALQRLTELTVRIGVEGMTCGSCARSVEERVGAVAGVSSVRASLEDAAAVIGYRPAEVAAEALRDVIEEMGFAATLGSGE